MSASATAAVSAAGPAVLSASSKCCCICFRGHALKGEIPGVIKDQLVVGRKQEGTKSAARTNDD